MGRVVYKVPKKISLEIYYNGISLPRAPAFSCHTTSLASHRKTHWTMSMHLLSLEKYVLGDLNFHDPSAIFSLV